LPKFVRRESVADRKLPHFSNAYLPIVLTEFGIVIAMKAIPKNVSRDLRNGYIFNAIGDDYFVCAARITERDRAVFRDLAIYSVFYHFFTSIILFS
jgi:hypothetical protein